jgi:hypothetical protein
MANDARCSGCVSRGTVSREPPHNTGRISSIDRTIDSVREGWGGHCGPAALLLPGALPRPRLLSVIVPGGLGGAGPRRAAARKPGAPLSGGHTAALRVHSGRCSLGGAGAFRQQRGALRAASGRALAAGRLVAHNTRASGLHVFRLVSCCHVTWRLWRQSRRSPGSQSIPSERPGDRR